MRRLIALFCTAAAIICALDVWVGLRQEAYYDSVIVLVALIVAGAGFSFGLGAWLLRRAALDGVPRMFSAFVGVFLILLALGPTGILMMMLFNWSPSPAQVASSPDRTIILLWSACALLPWLFSIRPVSPASHTSRVKAATAMSPANQPDPSPAQAAPLPMGKDDD